MNKEEKTPDRCDGECDDGIWVYVLGPLAICIGLAVIAFH